MVIHMKIGDYVSRNSYQNDVIFEIVEINDNALLKGIHKRIIADSPLEDLKLVSAKEIEEEEKSFHNHLFRNKRNRNFISGKILHIDGDQTYLEKCLNFYKMVGCHANGAFMDESKMSENIIKLIERYNPDIIVITGHDSYNKKGIKDINNYRNSQNFINTVNEIRKRYSRDDKFIIAGACQSHFEALIAAGANFAMSPKRVNVHLFDPAIIAIKASFTPFNEKVSLNEILKFSYIKKDGIGGIESYGKMRILL